MRFRHSISHKVFRVLADYSWHILVVAGIGAFALDPSMAYPLEELGELGWSASQLLQLQRFAKPQSPPPTKRPVPSP